MDDIKKSAQKYESDLNTALARNFEIESQIEEAKAKATAAEKTASDALARARKAEKVFNFTDTKIQSKLIWTHTEIQVRRLPRKLLSLTVRSSLVKKVCPRSSKTWKQTMPPSKPPWCQTLRNLPPWVMPSNFARIWKSNDLSDLVSSMAFCRFSTKV